MKPSHTRYDFIPILNPLLQAIAVQFNVRGTLDALEKPFAFKARCAKALQG